MSENESQKSPAQLAWESSWQAVEYARAMRRAEMVVLQRRLLRQLRRGRQEYLERRATRGPIARAGAGVRLASQGRVTAPVRCRARLRGAGRPRAVASRVSSRGGDSGDDGSGSSDPEPSSSARRFARRACLSLPACGRAGR